jgi:hypothetical protein
VGFDPFFTAAATPETYTLDLAATGIDTKIRYVTKFENWELFPIFHVVGALIKWEENF